MHKDERMTEIPGCSCFLVDIDGTLTGYRPGAVAREKLLHGNFLLPVIRDMMVARSWEKPAAEAAILDLLNRTVFWDYSDFLAEFRLPVKEGFRRMKEWHRENLFAYEDGVSLVKRLHAQGRNLFIMSNNPYLGCLFKLQAAGLAEDDFSSPYFRRIFGTNLLRGCKSVPDVWLRALAQIPADPSDVCVIGDNPCEDGEIPASAGIASHIILDRGTIVRGVENTGRTDSLA